MLTRCISHPRLFVSFANTHSLTEHENDGGKGSLATKAEHAIQLEPNVTHNANAERLSSPPLRERVSHAGVLSFLLTIIINWDFFWSDMGGDRNNELRVEQSIRKLVRGRYYLAGFGCYETNNHTKINVVNLGRFITSWILDRLIFKVNCQFTKTKNTYVSISKGFTMLLD